MNNKFLKSFTTFLLLTLLFPNAHQAQQGIENLIGIDLSDLEFKIAKREKMTLIQELATFSPGILFENISDSIFQVTTRNQQSKVERKYHVLFSSTTVVRYSEDLLTGAKTEVRSEFWQGKLHGSFEQYFPNQVVGKFEESIAIGEWKIDKKEYYTIEVNFGDTGLPQGTYAEYYGTMVNHTGLKTRGTYSTLSNESGFLCDHCFQDQMEQTWSIRTGKWELFHRGGALAQVIHYNEPEKR
jgi:hypothetical protein